jgi:hypothetical protein
MAEHQQRMNQAMAANNAIMSLLERRQSQHEVMVSEEKTMLPL